MIRKINKIRYLFVLAAFASPWAQAVSVSPGSTVALPGTTVAAEPDLAGLVVQDDTTPFTICCTNSNPGGGPVNITGSVQERVVLAADGFYDFYWRVFVDSTSTAALGYFRLGNFGSLTANYNINYRTDGLGSTAPGSVTRFSPQANFYNYNFNPGGIAPGSTSFFLFMDTNATSYSKAAFYDVTDLGQNPISAPFATWGPTPVPIPAAVWLLSSAVAALGLLRRRPPRAA
jgi:hypothetical protein